MTYKPLYTQADDKEKFSKIKEYAFKVGYNNCVRVLEGDLKMYQITSQETKEEEFKNCEYTDVDVNCVSDLQFSKFENAYLDGMSKAESEMNAIEKEEQTEEVTSALF